MGKPRVHWTIGPGKRFPRKKMTKDGVKNVKTHDFGNHTLKMFPIN